MTIDEVRRQTTLTRDAALERGDVEMAAELDEYLDRIEVKHLVLRVTVVKMPYLLALMLDAEAELPVAGDSDMVEIHAKVRV